MTSVTVRAWLAKYSAAWPAECPADQVNIEAMRRGRFAARRTVEDALADQPVEAIDGEAAPRDPGGENDGACVDDIAAIDVHLAGLRIEPRDRARHEGLRPQSARLLQRAACKFVAGNAARETEIVFDAR